MIIDDELLLPSAPARRIAPGVTVTRRAVVQGLLAGIGVVATGCRGPRPIANSAPTADSPPRQSIEDFVAALRPHARGLLAVPGGASAADEELYLRSVAAALTRVEPESAWRPGRGEVAMGMLAFLPPLFVYEIVMAPGARIEWHDHRDYNGALTPVEGSVSVQYAHFATATGSHHSVSEHGPDGPFFVRVGGRVELMTGRVATLARDRDNLHEVVAGRDGARLIDCFTHFAVTARSHELTLEPTPVDARIGLFRAHWRS